MIAIYIMALIFFVSGSALLKWFHFMIQPNGALDVVLNYQQFLKRMYNGIKLQQLLGKAMGDCEMCMSYWFAYIWYVLFYLSCKIFLGIWLTDNTYSIAAIVFINFMALLIFQPLCAMCCFLTLSKLFKK